MQPLPPKTKKPFQYPIIRVINPGKGLNTLASNEVIQDQEASDLNNVVITELGSVTKSPGTSAWGSGLVSNPRGLGSFNVSNGTHYVLTMDGTGLKYTTGASDTWHAITGVTYTAGLDVTFTQIRTISNAQTGTDAIFVWNGTDAGSYWDGSTLHQPGTIPSGAFSIFYSGYHIVSGTASNQNRLYISDSRDATSFTVPSFSGSNTPGTTDKADNPIDVPTTTAAGVATTGIGPNFIDIQPRDGDKITGLAKFNGVLIVFKSRSIYQVAFDPSSGVPTVTPIITYLGAVGHRSIDNIDNDLFYLSSLGYFTLGYQQSYYNIIRTNELSQRIHPLIQTINPTNLPRVASIYQPYRFYSSVASGGSSTNNLTLVYDKRYDAWTKMDYVHAESFTVFIDSTNTQHLLYTDDAAAQVWEISESTFSNNGTAIDAYWQSKAFNAGEPELYKRWIDLTVTFRQITGNITITVYSDNGTVAHTSTINSQSTNGGIGSTGFIGSELYGGNATTPMALVTTITNLITNPSIETATTGWGSLQGVETISKSSTQAKAGTSSLKCITTGASSQGVTYSVTGLTSGAQYNYGGWVFMPLGVAFTVEVDQFNVSSGFISASTAAFVGTGTWQQVGVTTVLTSTAVKVTTIIFVGSTIQTFYVDEMIFSLGANTPFDGSLTSTATDIYAWTGTAHASTSTHMMLSTATDPTPVGSPGTSTSVVQTTNVPYRIKMNVKSRTLMFKIREQNDVNNTFSGVGFALTYQPYSHFVFPSGQRLQ